MADHDRPLPSPRAVPHPSASPTGRARRVGAGPAAEQPAEGADAQRVESADTQPAEGADEQPARPPVEQSVPPPSGPSGEEVAVQDTGTSRAGRNLPAAIGVGVGLGAVVVASLFGYRPSFAVLVGLAVVYGSYELSRALRQAGVHVSLVPLVVGGVAMLASAWARGPNGLVIALLLTVCAVLIWRLGEGARGYLRDVSASTLILLYLPTLAGFAVLSAHPHDGAARVLAFVATVVCSDTGGYLTGVLLGRHPLAPLVSKAKTWEGFAGSVLFCVVAGVLLLTRTFHQAWWTGVVFGLAIAVTATIGDLGESLIKRDLGIKDMGQLLPGHGGLMERLDSLLPCAAVGYLILSAVAPVG